MRASRMAAVVLAAMLTLTGLTTWNVAAGPPHRPDCDRQCLNGFVDQYLDALIAHDPGQVPMADDVRLTENGQRLQPGDGLWRTMTAKGTYRFFVTDVPAGQVAFIGTIRQDSGEPNGGNPATIALRLKIEHRQLSEIETFVVRDPETAQRIEALGTPNPVFSEAIPPGRQESRDELVKTANRYFSGMQLNDGRGEYPFADDCNRIENGMQTTNVPMDPRPDPETATSYSIAWSCREQFESGLLRFVTRIHDRRFVAVDQDQGVVYSFVFFDHAAGATRTFQTPDGRTVTNGPTEPWTWEIAEVFKVEDGKIRRIEAVLDRAPYGMSSGWSSWEEGMSTKARDVTGVR